MKEMEKFSLMETEFLLLTAVQYMEILYEPHHKEKGAVVAIDASVNRIMDDVELEPCFIFSIAVGFKQSSISISGVNTSHAITVLSETLASFSYIVGVDLSITAFDDNRR